MTSTNMVEDGSRSITVMATPSNASATPLFLINILILVCLDALYYIPALAWAPRKILVFPLRRRATTVRFSILGLALAITLNKIVSNLVVHHESLIDCAQLVGYIFARSAPVIGGALLSFWVVALAIAPVLKWRPAVRRMLRSGPNVPVEKHVPFMRWSYEERLVLHALESRRRQEQQQRRNVKKQPKFEKEVTPAASESTFRDTADPNQVLRENFESRSICALIGLNYLWFLMAAIEWYMASGAFGEEEEVSLLFISIQVMQFSFLSLYYWLDCLITWGEALVEVRRAQH